MAWRRRTCLRRTCLRRCPPPEIVTPLPPNRPMGANIPELSDAAQEFLTDWLVRHKYDEAMEFISDESLTCLVAEPGIDLEKGDAAGHAGSPRRIGQAFG